MKKRRWPFVLAAVVALLLLVDAALWFAAQRALASGFASWAMSMARQGLTVTAGPASLGGYPLNATRSFAVTMRAGDASIRSDRIALVLSPTSLRTVRVDLPAPVAIAALLLPPVLLASPDWHLDAAFDGSAVQTDAKDLDASVAGPNGGARHAQAALVHLQKLPLADALNVVGSAQSIVLPEPLPGEVWPLGRHVASAAFEADVRGQFPPATASEPWLSQAALSAWRDSGGAIDLRRLAVGYGPLGLAGNASFTLDAQLQPAASATLRLLGYAETLDALVAAHFVTTHTARAATAVLALLARAPEGGGTPQVTLDAQMRDRVLTVAGLPLLKLPVLTWPGAV